MKTRPTTVRGTPINHVGPSAALVGGKEGYGASGSPPGYDGQTTKDQYRGTGFDTTQGPGTPYNTQQGNPDEAMRTASSGRYGVSPGAGGVDMNDPKANGDGVVFDHTSVDYASPKAAPTLDSPVPGNAPAFDTGKIVTVNEARLGKGVDPAHARDDLLKVGGVMSRGPIPK